MDKAVLILTALTAGPTDLAGLMARTKLPRATAHRLAAALEVHGLVDRADGRYRLGAGLAAMAKAAAPTPRLDLVSAAGPVLGALRDRTGESAQLYVASSDATTRVCLAAAESPQGLRTIVAVGAVLPMDRGSAGKVLTGAPKVMARGWAESVEEREPGVASVSAPVVFEGRVVAAISVSGPIGRTTRQPGRRYAPAVVAAAAAVAAGLEG